MSVVVCFAQSNVGKEAQTQDKPEDGPSMKSQSGKQVRLSICIGIFVTVHVTV